MYHQQEFKVYYLRMQVALHVGFCRFLFIILYSEFIFLDIERVPDYRHCKHV